MEHFFRVSDLPRSLQDLLPDFETTPMTTGPFRYHAGDTVFYLHENQVKTSHVIGRMCVEYHDGFVRLDDHPVDGVWYLTVDGFMHQDKVYQSLADLAHAINHGRL